MTLCRGPWLGGFAGAILTGVVRTKNRKRALWAIVVCILAIGVPTASLFYSYASVGRSHAKTATQETAAYRMELLDKYVGIVLKQPWWGYGHNTWPRVQGAPSIDNYYLLLCLMHGLVAAGLYVAMMLIMLFRLVHVDMASPPSIPLGSSLGFTLAGIYVLYAVTVGTVYMGLQTIPLFAIITGWSEAYLITHRRELVIAQPAFSFARVVA
jgi:hypothetical protein